MGTLNPDIPSEELTRALNEASTVMRGYRQRVLMPEHLPKGVPITGKAFGKGIYSAPCWPDSRPPSWTSTGALRPYRRSSAWSRPRAWPQQTSALPIFWKIMVI